VDAVEPVLVGEAVVQLFDPDLEPVVEELDVAVVVAVADLKDVDH
jgi:hypothetical protein